MTQGKGKTHCREAHYPRSQTRHLDPPGLTKIGQGETLKLHLKRAPQGEGCSVETGDSGPSMGRPSQTPPEKNQPEESEGTV